MKKVNNKNSKLSPHKVKKLNRNNLQAICRTCLEVFQSPPVSTRSFSENYNIREAPGLKELLETIALLNINEETEQEYPQLLCSKCYNTLKEFQHFRDMVQQSSEWLRKIFKNDAMEVEIENEADIAIEVDKGRELTIKVEKEMEIDALFKVETMCDDSDGDNLLEEARSEIFESILMSEADKSNDTEPEAELEIKVENEAFADGDVASCKIGPVEDKIYVQPRTSKEVSIKARRTVAATRSAKLSAIVSSKNDLVVDEANRKMVNGLTDEIDVQPSTSKEAAVKRRANVAGTSAAKFKCPIEGCVAGYLQKINLKAHYESVHSSDESNTLAKAIEKEIQKLQDQIKANKLWCCLICPKKYKEKRLLDQHMKLGHRPRKIRPLICKICGDAKGNAVEMKIHMKLHDTHVKCPRCPMMLVSKHVVQRHIRIVHEGERDHKCNLCPRTFHGKSRLENHLKAHETKPFFCEKCYGRFGSEVGLKYHISDIHQRRESQMICRYCPMRFVMKYNLDKHERKHKQSELICATCGEVAKTDALLKLHMRTHKPEELRFICEICFREFRLSGNLRRHEQEKHGHSAYKCDVCKKCFKNKTLLKYHKNRHTGEEKFKCTSCAKEFINPYLLRCHMLSHKVTNENQTKRQKTLSVISDKDCVLSSPTSPTKLSKNCIKPYALRRNLLLHDVNVTNGNQTNKKDKSLSVVSDKDCVLSSPTKLSKNCIKPYPFRRHSLLRNVNVTNQKHINKNAEEKSLNVTSDEDCVLISPTSSTKLSKN